MSAIDTAGRPTTNTEASKSAFVEPFTHSSSVSSTHAGAPPAKRLARKTPIAARHGDTVSKDYLADAQQLARSAERFRSDVEDQTVSDAKVTAQFQRMAGDYRRFNEHIEHANTEQASAGLNAVTTPYKELIARRRARGGGEPSTLSYNLCTPVRGRVGEAHELRSRAHGTRKWRNWQTRWT
jgi:hypothetical protein